MYLQGLGLRFSIDDHFVPFFPHEYNYNSQAKSFFSKQILPWFFQCRQRRKIRRVSKSGEQCGHLLLSRILLLLSFSALICFPNVLPTPKGNTFLLHTLSGGLWSMSQDQKHSILLKMQFLGPQPPTLSAEPVVSYLNKPSGPFWGSQVWEPPLEGKSSSEEAWKLLTILILNPRCSKSTPKCLR